MNTSSIIASSSSATPRGKSKNRSSSETPSTTSNNQKLIKSSSTTKPPPIHHQQNIHVCVRIRPNDDQEQEPLQIKLLYQSETDTHIQVQFDKEPPKQYQYDHVLDENVSQEQVFDLIGKPVVSELRSGFNTSILCYGHTGSGKTFTMGTNLEKKEFENGISGNCGLLPRIVQSILNEKKEGEELSCSLFEIYNKCVYDLIGDEKNKCSIKELGREFVVEGAKTRILKSLSDLSAVSSGLKKRHQSFTNSNSNSSRSHCIFKLFYINSKNNTTTCLNMVDLAGSERQKVANTNCNPELLEQAKYINSSLSCLNRCIDSILDIQNGKKGIVPYRDDPLTKLLQSTLGGNAKTFFVGNVGGGSESINTLNYAQLARGIKKSTFKFGGNESGGLFHADIEKLKKELEKTKNELDESKLEREGKEKKIQELSEQIQSLEKNQQEANEILKQSNSKIEEMKIRDDSWRETLKEKNESISILFEELENMTLQRTSMKNEIVRLKYENSLLMERNEKNRETISMHEEEYNSAFQNLKEQLDESYKESASKTILIQSLEKLQNESREETQKHLKLVEEKDKIIQEQKDNISLLIEKSSTKELLKMNKKIEQLLKTNHDQKKTINGLLKKTVVVIHLDDDGDDVKMEEKNSCHVRNKRKVISPLKEISYPEEECNEPVNKQSKVKDIHSK